MARDLSPFSQRRLLTQQLARGEVPTPPRVVAEKVPSKEPERTSKEPSVPSRRRSRSKSRERRPRDPPKERKPRGSPPASRPSRHGREGSPEPDRPRDDKRSHSPLTIRERKQRTRSASASRSPPAKRRRRSRSRSRSRSPHQRNKKPLPDQEVSFRGVDNSNQAPTKYGGAPVNKEKPNFKMTGALAKHANRVEGTKISLKYHEPPEARKPPTSQPWRIFVFKGDDVIDTIELWQKSCWLLGRSHEVVDYMLEHPSSSGQHAVIQFKYTQKTVEDEFGVKSTKGRVKPYVIDLESSNGTELNGKDIEASRYFELRDKDILKFAGSEREYVVMLPPPEEKKD
ncbi:hypothetical protein N0V87_002139 [Didymella glomerata]|uniref:FHA domain-containing protein n=1 Tax=Didymella glomerata TaxID=749621 RepID=A0A9W9C2R4_9PLEO|nr:hypothetical protein N0V87_002139 [Didymella glomerata]